jgi:hypothetical protein
VHPLLDQLRETLGPHAADNAERPLSGCDAPAPRWQWPRLLHVNDADDSARCRRSRGVVGPSITDVLRDHGHLSGDTHRRLFAKEPCLLSVPTESDERGGVEPCAVQIRTDQDDGHVTGDTVEELAMGEVGPERVAKAVSDDRRFGISTAPSEVPVHETHGGSGTVARGQVEACTDLRPLVEMHVVVPKAGKHETSAGGDLIPRARKLVEIADCGNVTINDQHILRACSRCESRAVDDCIAAHRYIAARADGLLSRA